MGKSILALLATFSMRIVLSLLLTLYFTISFAQNRTAQYILQGGSHKPVLYKPSDDERRMLQFLSFYTIHKYHKVDFANYLYVSFKRQRLYHIVEGEIEQAYIISGAKKGAGNTLGTNKTPVGLHSISEKFGDHVPKNGLIQGRKYTGKVASVNRYNVDLPEDKITSRILWLKGEEPGINSGGVFDSFNRKIYIHGTSEEGLIGKLASDGCIRMRNNHVIALYEYAFVGMKVLILEE